MMKSTAKSIVYATCLAAVATTGSPANAATFTVFTGYADNLRPSGFFPTIWLGDGNVVSESSAVQSFDAGAIRIFNGGSSAFNITDFKVTMNGGSGPTYSFWNSLMVGAGQHGIFTQTFSYNFDSSDNSFGSPPGGIAPLAPGGNGIGGCSADLSVQVAAGVDVLCGGRAPIVTFKVDGVSYSFTDTGHILDTGNYDFVNYSPDGNESINWNLIGSMADRGGTGSVPEPATWAMMVLGFGALGASLRRRIATKALAV